MPSPFLSFRLVKTEQTGLAPDFLRELRDGFGLTTFVETGTYQGSTTALAAKLFKQVHTIELSPALHTSAVEKFSNLKHVHPHLGDSASLLPRILRDGPRERILFWLDGHYSGGATARAESNTPILAELQALADAGIRDSVVLVDDLRIFQPAPSVADGSLTGYPTFAELRDALKAVFPDLALAHLGDVAVAFDASLGVEFSPVLTACTASRLYDAGHPQDDHAHVNDVLKAEQIIAGAAAPEAKALLQLAAAYPSAEKHGFGGHYRLWAALVLAAQGNHAAAMQHFNRAVELGSRHWRLQCYIARSLSALGERAEALLALNEARRRAPGHLLVTATEQALLREVQVRRPRSTLARAFGVRQSSGVFPSSDHGAAFATDPPNPKRRKPAALQDAGAPSVILSTADLRSNGELAILRRFINPESVVFDVGAHAGDWSAAVLEHTSPRQLHLFDPLPGQFQSLLARFADRLKTGQVLAQAFALSDREELREFNYYPSSPAWSTFHRRTTVERNDGVPPPRRLRVPTVTLDSYCELAGIRRVNFLKVDVEGAEPEVLRGARRLLRRGDIDLLQFEYGGTYADAGATLQEVFSFLRAFDYEIFRISPRCLAHHPEFTDALEDFQYANYLAAHPRLRALLLQEKPRMLALVSLTQKHGIKPRGVIHVGAHEGKEYARYRAMGFEKMLFIEANPAVFARLQANIGNQPGVFLAQCAVSNASGTATFRVTSMDQSSSLLPLKRHRILYPDILETNSFDVRTVTLDALLSELSLNPADFNFLNLDIQGAELLALQGAEGTLAHIEGINTEVNFEELYEGCPRLEDIDTFLEANGFRRAALTTPFHPSWGDAFYIRQPVITLSSLGRNGRFANQLFQYAFLKCYAREHDLRVETPRWVGQKLFGLTDPPISRRLPEVRVGNNARPEAFGFSERARYASRTFPPLTPALSPLRGEGDAAPARRETDPRIRVPAFSPGSCGENAAVNVTASEDARRAPSPLNGERAGVRGGNPHGITTAQCSAASECPQPFRNVDLWGYFQFHSSYYAEYRDYLRSLFRPTSETHAQVQPLLERLGRRGKTMVGLHLRRGDYGYEHFFVAPSTWYLEWLRGLWPTLEDPVLFIASDEPQKVLADFAEFHPVTARDLGPSLPGADFYPDFHLLSQCDVLAISNSSFSFAAAMLNERATIFARPHLPTRKLVPFDPWNSEVIFRDARVPPPGAMEDKEKEMEGRGPQSSHLPPPSAVPGPTFSFVTIVLNGMPFLEFSLRAVYDFAHEIIIVEGAVEKCRFAANPDGSSTDGTVECIRNFPDPQNKIRLFQGTWPEKCEMQNEGLRHVTGDYAWLMDSDEVYRRADLEKVRQLIRQDATITQVNFIPDNFWKGFDYRFVSARFLEPAGHYRRLFKFAPGAQFTSHRPPTMVHPGIEWSTEQQHCIPGDVTRAMGIIPFHYSYVLESQVRQKIELYNRYGWSRSWKVDLNEWFREGWQKWTPANRVQVEKAYPPWTGGESHTEPFTGEHPEVMREFIERCRIEGERAGRTSVRDGDQPPPSPPPESTLLPSIGTDRYLRFVLDAWRCIDLDAPLLKRRATIEDHLRQGTPFWNNHVGLAFLADRLRPASYLEIGVRTGGSFVQVLRRAPLRDAVALDLWSGSYSDLPNTHEFAAAQIDRCRTGFQPVSMFNGPAIPPGDANPPGGSQDASQIVHCRTGLQPVSASNEPNPAPSALRIPEGKEARASSDNQSRTGFQPVSMFNGLTIPPGDANPPGGSQDASQIVHCRTGFQPVSASNEPTPAPSALRFPEGKEARASSDNQSRTGFQPVSMFNGPATPPGDANPPGGGQDACPTWPHIELRQGNSHVELKKLIAEGRRFDLINVDGDHTDAGALEDLEDALQLLSPRGAILFDDVIHPGFRSLLGVVKDFAATHPELQLLLNTTQDNGVAILLKGVTWEEIMATRNVEQRTGSDSRPPLAPTHHSQISRAGLQSDPDRQDACPTPALPRRVKVAGDHATRADLTQIDSESAFAQAIRKLFAEIRPRHIIETGTYLGTGTTKVIAAALRDLKLKGTRFDSIEVKDAHFEAACRNLATSGLAKFVRLHQGLSVPRRLLPTVEQIEEMTVRNPAFDDIFVDHREHERARLYFQETDFAGVTDDLLGQCVRRCEGRPDFVLLDSAGHLGHIEFNHLLGLLQGPCVIALDDVHHIKHAASLRQMRGDARFEILVESREKFGFCIARFTPKPVALEPDVQRLLWVRTDSIGDAVLASSMLPHIRRKYPNARIAVLCQERLAEFYTACPLVETVICFDPQAVTRDAACRQTIVSEIAAFRPDLVLNSIYSRDAITELLTHSANAPRTIGIAGDLGNISRSEHEKARSLYTELIPTPGPWKCELDRHRDFLAGLGLKEVRLVPTVWTSPEDDALAEAFFEEQKLDPANTVALFPGAQHERRVYPHLARALQGFRGARFLIFGGTEVESAANALAANLPGLSVNLCGKTTLREMAALIRKCRLFVGTESAGAHLAAAVGVPNVVIIGGGHFGRFMPWSPLTSLAALPLDCYGCNWHCRFASPHCVKDVAPEVVAEAIRQTLESRSARSRIFAPSAVPWSSKENLPAWQDARRWLGSIDVEVIPVRTTPVRAQEASSCALPPAVAELVRQADEHFAAGRLSDAIPLLSRAASLAPDHPELPVALANLHCEQGNLPAAHEALERATRLRPDDATLHVLLANLCLQRQQIDAFEAALGRALQIDPQHPQALRLLADLNLQHGRYADAARGYAGLVRQDPQNLEVLLALGRCFFETGEWEAARASYEQVLKFDPLHSVAAENLQVVQARQNACDKTNTTRPVAAGRDAVRPEPGSADLQSAVSPTSSRRSAGQASLPGTFERRAEGDSAIQQIGKSALQEDTPPCLIPTPPLDGSPLVTAIVSTYNAERFIRGCLEDLEAQTISDRLEIIVIDSGSEQNERAIVEEFQQRHANIVYVRTERESLYAAWNRAIAIARGKYLTNANTDDRHRPDAYEILARALDEHPVGLVYADSLITRVENETFATTKATRRFDWPEFTLKELLLRNYFGPHPMWRRSVHEVVGSFDPSYTIAGDYDFNLRVAARFGAQRVPEVLGLYLEGGLEWRHRQRCVEETRRLLRHHRRAIAIEGVCPELRQPDLSVEAKTRLLVDYATALSKTWHPDPELAREILQRRTGFQPVSAQSQVPACAGQPDSVPDRQDARPNGRTGFQPVSVAPQHDLNSQASGHPLQKDCFPGYSFCIITNGQRPEKLRAQLDSIRALGINRCEILVGGDAPPNLGADVTVVPIPEAARAGRLGEMRNRLVERARFDTLVVADDDMLFHSDFHQGIEKFGQDFDVLCVRLLNPDGSRFWDWATVGGPRGQCVLDYTETDPFLYVTGGLCIMKARVAAKVRWDEKRGFYQAEDVDFSRRLQREGFRIQFNPHSTVTHNDPRYTLDGPVVVRVDGAFRLARDDYQAGRRQLARHRLERALRLWPGPDTETEVAAIIREFNDTSIPKAQPGLQSGAGKSSLREASFESKLPVRWVAPVFASADDAQKVLSVVRPLASRVWLGLLHHGGEYSDAVVQAIPEADREALFALADRLPAMLGGIGVSQAAPEALAKLPGAVRHVGFLCGLPKKLTRKQAACCAQMDELWVPRQRDVSTLTSSGIAADKVHVITNAEEVLARLRTIEASVLGSPDGSSPTESQRAGPADRSSLAQPAVAVAWEGSFLDLGSLSHVNRELTAELARRPGLQLACVGRNALPKELAGMAELVPFARRLQPQSPSSAQVTVRHAWPPHWQPPRSGAWVLIQPWEFGALPVDWLPPLARVDEVWVPSEFVRRCYVDSGVEGRKVQVVPNGINPERYRPDAKPLPLTTKKTFKFLFVGGTIHRKGPDLLLRAWLEGFTAADDVCLVIKDFGGQGVYAGQTFGEQIRAAQSRAGAPEILYLTEDIPLEAMPGLYTACDCLVLPYRGEGFGLPVLEAMACGLPVIVTGGGATDDFATDEFAYRLPARRKEFGNSVSGMKLVTNGWLLEPDFSSLVERLKWVVNHREEARAKGRAASVHVRQQWTWTRAAQCAGRRLHEIATRAPATSIGTTSCRPPKPLELPACARLGHLGEAHTLFEQGKLVAAWNATVAAMLPRPFHPEACHLLAGIAQAAGQPKLSKELVERARQWAPKGKGRRTNKSHRNQDRSRVTLPALPQPFRPGPHLPRLTVCLIARNEEQFIGRCLESIRPIVEQIVVVDTGSTDWTTNIAARFGAEIYQFDWCDDFSAARNVALEKATGDWVLMLDADEELPPDQHDKLLALLRDPSAMAYRLPIVDAGREADGPSYVPRLFRNAPGLFYVGRVHEQVFSSIEVRRAEWGLENKLGDATLLHHGYAPEVVRSRDKTGRNLRLLERAIEELPGDPNLLMNFGLELARAGRLQEGLGRYAEAFQALSSLPKDQVVPELRESLLTQYSSHLLSAKRPADVVRVLTSAVAMSAGLTASMHWLLGLAQMGLKQHAEAVEQMQQCLARRNQPALSPVQKDIRKAGPHHCLALCLAALKQNEAADEAFRAARREDAKARPVRIDHARFLADIGRGVEALETLHQLMAEDPNDFSTWLLGGRVALSRPEFLEFACDWTGEAMKLHPGQTALVEQRAQALMLSGRAAEALPLWRSLAAATAHPAHVAARVLCEVCADAQPSRLPSGANAEVNRHFVQWYRRLIASGATAIIQTLNRRLDSLRLLLPEATRLIETALAQAA